MLFDACGKSACFPVSVETGSLSELDAARGVHQHQDKVAGFEGLVDLLQHAAVELRAGLVDAGRVDEDDLRGRDAGPLRAGTSTTPAMRLRVVCGLAVTMATFSPVRALRRVLLPTLGRPRMATNPDFTRDAAPD